MTVDTIRKQAQADPFLRFHSQQLESRKAAEQQQEERRQAEEQVELREAQQAEQEVLQHQVRPLAWDHDPIGSGSGLCNLCAILNVSFS
eukprot:COSAG04_NODE_17367_length_471_cov_0.932796_1_plen_88_part_01